MSSQTGYLLLEDGTVFRGRSVAAAGSAYGEAVFTTGMTGYQEVITDPSYAGQLVTMTAPQMGNTGINAEDAETVKTIKDLIETRVRPAVANDGGDITFRGFKEGIVYLNMQGACSGCPSSTATLKHGIQNLLRHFVPEVVEVRPI